MTAGRPSQLDESEVTVSQAATLLNVSEAFVRDLLATGEIASRTMSGGTRVLAPSLMAYQKRDDAHRRAAADELTLLSQELGLDNVAGDLPADRPADQNLAQQQQ